MTALEAAIEAELDRLARRHESPEAFEALFRCLWLASLSDKLIPADAGINHQ